MLKFGLNLIGAISLTQLKLSDLQARIKSGSESRVSVYC